MKVAFIHNDKKIGTGAHYINDLIATKLKQLGVDLKNFYPRVSLSPTPTHLNGIKNILFFFSLLERRKEVLKFNIIQGTTYTPLPFLAYPTPVVSHFGSTTRGFLLATPRAKNIEPGPHKVWYMLRRKGVIKELNTKTRRPLRDIADIEEYVASRATAVIATSEKVRKELLVAGVKEENIHLIHNAIEDYWFETPEQPLTESPSIVFLGRLGNDAFTLKLKGLDRLIHLYQRFPDIPKSTFCISTNRTLLDWLRNHVPNHSLFSNTEKDKLPEILSKHNGSILFISSRYEGFSLSLVEGMSQGLIPIVYEVGIAPEIIRNGENGYLVSSQKEAFDRIEEILSNPALRRTLAQNARAAAKQFTSKNIAEKLMKVYQQISIIPAHQRPRPKSKSLIVKSR